MISYTQDLLKKVQGLLSIGFQSLQMAYRDLRSFQPNSATLRQLDSNARNYAFLHFESH